VATISAQIELGRSTNSSDTSKDGLFSIVSAKVDPQVLSGIFRLELPPNAYLIFGTVKRECSSLGFTTTFSVAILCDCLAACTLVSRLQGTIPGTQVAGNQTYSDVSLVALFIDPFFLRGVSQSGQTGINLNSHYQTAAQLTARGNSQDLGVVCKLFCSDSILEVCNETFSSYSEWMCRSPGSS
jgi:hypothetical protein